MSVEILLRIFLKVNIGQVTKGSVMKMTYFFFIFIVSAH